MSEELSRPRRGLELRPRGMRVRLYEEFLWLRRLGSSYNEIIKEVERLHGERLSKSIISEWVRGIHLPYNGRRVPSIEHLRPSPELAYIIGSWFGMVVLRGGEKGIAR